MERWFDAEKDADYRGVLKVWTEGGRVPLKYEDIHTMIHAMQAGTLRPTVKTQMTTITRAYKLITICVYFMHEMDENAIPQIAQSALTVTAVKNALVKLSGKVLSTFHCTPSDFGSALGCVEFIHMQSAQPALLESDAGKQWTLMGMAWKASGVLKVMYSSWKYLLYRVNQTQQTDGLVDVFAILKAIIRQQNYRYLTRGEILRILFMNFMSLVMVIPRNELVHLKGVVDMALEYTLHGPLTPEDIARYKSISLDIRKNRVVDLNVMSIDDIYAVTLYTFQHLATSADDPKVADSFATKAVAPASMNKEQWDTLIADCAAIQPTGEVLKDYLDVNMLPDEEDGIRAYAQAYLAKVQPNALYRSLIAPYYILRMRNLNIAVMEQRVQAAAKRRVAELAPEVVKGKDGQPRSVPLLLMNAIEIETACNLYREYMPLRV